MSIGIAGQRIITQGLGINHDACSDGIITTHFSLYCREIVSKGGGGGPYPAGKGAWNQFDRAQDIFQPVDQNVYDPDKFYRERKEVIIRIEFGKFHMEKIYLIPIERANIVIKAINLLNVTKEKISVSINKIHRILHNIKVSINNLRRK